MEAANRIGLGAANRIAAGAAHRIAGRGGLTAHRAPAGGYALGGWTIALQRAADGSTRMWSFHMLLGAFVPGRDTTIQPCAVDTRETVPGRHAREQVRQLLDDA